MSCRKVFRTCLNEYPPTCLNNHEPPRPKRGGARRGKRGSTRVAAARGQGRQTVFLFTSWLLCCGVRRFRGDARMIRALLGARTAAGGQAAGLGLRAAGRPVQVLSRHDRRRLPWHDNLSWLSQGSRQGWWDGQDSSEGAETECECQRVSRHDNRAGVTAFGSVLLVIRSALGLSRCEEPLLGPDTVR